jgi:uncharacterized membrane protein
MAFCSSCGGQLPAGATVCPACGHSATAAAVAATAATTSNDNVMGALAYVTIVPPILFLVMEPYNKNKFIRFHSFQCLFTFAFFFALVLAVMIIGFIPVLGLISLPIYFVVFFGGFILWIILVLKAYQGQMFKLPIVGDMAEKQANAY